MDSVRSRVNEHSKIRRKKFLFGIIAVAILVIGAVLLEKQIYSKPTDVTIMKNKISDERASFIPLKELDTNIIAVKATDGSYRLAFDDCEGCYIQYGVHSKYKMNSDKTGLICKNCKHEVFYDDIGFTEECKPVSIYVAEITQEEDRFVLDAEYLERKKSELEGMREGILMKNYQENINNQK